ncbi:MAG: DUF1501 domain-containing protein [Verrucomicrobia bacterium]|nr:DUF1501 domain-containing protein [Verrucomicrobiota bacterium]
MDPLIERQLIINRRHFFKTTGLAMGRIALAGMMFPQLARAGGVNRAIGRSHPGLPDLPHFAPKAKRMIYLFMNGGPSQMDLLDHKPGLQKIFDSDLPESIRQGQRLTTMTSGQSRFPIAPSKYAFKQYGKSGMWFSELLQNTAKVADDLAVIKSVNTEAINHDPAVTYIQTGRQIPGNPSLGSWLSYGLGSECDNLPSFVVMTPSWSAKRDAQALYQRLWSSGFLPTKHSGVALRGKGDPVLYINDPPGVDKQTRRHMLDGLAKLNAEQYKTIGDPEINTRIAQYEMAFQMQSSVPELTELTKESKATLDLYGPEVTTPGTFAHSCLMARRMAERGVRCVEIFHREWDHHFNLTRDLPLQCRDVDQACFGLITDLKNRGMLEDTLVVWGGEFGRTVYCQGKLTPEDYGRDHHPRCFSMWMAGGGIKGGITYGETDDFSYNVVQNPVHISEINATMLHCLGIDHRKLTFKFQGLDQRLTGVEDRHVVKGILA